MPTLAPTGRSSTLRALRFDDVQREHFERVLRAPATGGRIYGKDAPARAARPCRRPTLPERMQKLGKLRRAKARW
jgi:hypothetical protein